eukprot:864676-Alexandrium_andersonii.AAC.1
MAMVAAPRPAAAAAPRAASAEGGRRAQPCRRRTWWPAVSGSGPDGGSMTALPDVRMAAAKPCRGICSDGGLLARPGGEECR